MHLSTSFVNEKFLFVNYNAFKINLLNSADPVLGPVKGCCLYYSTISLSGVIAHFVKGQSDAVRRIRSDSVSFRVAGSKVITRTLKLYLTL